jgi:glycosyltransferase involved in cell wall biosynthesis
MPTYNRAKTVIKAIDSVLAQSFNEYELIIINDGSTDETTKICSEYAQKENKIRFINRLQNKGASFARNIGIKVSDGDYITFVDDDDVIHCKMLEFLYGLTITHGADISICGSWYGYGENVVPKYKYDELILLDKVTGLDELLKREKYNSSNACKLFCKKLFRGINYIEKSLVDDIHVVYKLFAEANTVVAKGVPMYTCMRHGENNSNLLENNIWSPELLREYINMQKDRVKYLSQCVPQITDRVKYSEWSFYISMCHKINIFNNWVCKKEYREMLNILKENKVEFLNSKFITESEKTMIKMYNI